MSSYQARDAQVRDVYKALTARPEVGGESDDEQEPLSDQEDDEPLSGQEDDELELLSGQEDESIRSRRGTYTANTELRRPEER